MLSIFHWSLNLFHTSHGNWEFPDTGPESVTSGGSLSEVVDIKSFVLTLTQHVRVRLTFWAWKFYCLVYCPRYPVYINIRDPFPGTETTSGLSPTTICFLYGHGDVLEFCQRELETLVGAGHSRVVINTASKTDEKQTSKPRNLRKKIDVNTKSSLWS